MFDNFNVNLRKNEGFLTYIPCIPIPEYGQSNAPLGNVDRKYMPLPLILVNAMLQHWANTCSI